MAKKLRALLTGFFHETNTYATPGDLSFFTRTAGQNLIDQNRGANTPCGGYIEFCEKMTLNLWAGFIIWTILVGGSCRTSGSHRDRVEGTKT